MEDGGFRHRYDQWATSAGFPNPGQRCILFTSSKNRAQHQDALAVWSGLAADDEKEVIYAMVDLDSNKKAGCWAPAREGCLPEAVCPKGLHQS